MCDLLLPYDLSSISSSSLAFATSRRKGQKIRKRGGKRLSKQKFKINSDKTWGKGYHQRIRCWEPASGAEYRELRLTVFRINCI